MSTPGPPKAGRGRGGRGKGRGGGGGRGKGRGGNSANTSTSTSPSASTSNNTSANMNPEAKANKPKGRNRNRGKGGRGRGSKGKQPEELTKEQQEAAQAEEVLRKQKEAQEAEAKRLAAEEEAKKKEIDRQRKEQEAFEQEIRDAQETIESFLEIIQQREESRKAMEATALAEKRKEFNTQKKKLKTDVKKCTAFCKKLKSAAAWNDEKSVEQAVQTLNLSRYVDEVVKALLESKPKVADLPVILTLCRAMHTRYPDFMTNLLPALWSAISSKTPETSKVRRLYLRWITELHLAGLVPDTKALCKCIAEATGSAQNYAVQDAPLLLAFCKAGSPEILQVTPLSVANAVSWIRQQDATNPLVAEAISVADTLDETWKPTPHDTDTKQGQAYTVLQEHCNNAYHSLAESWVTTHRKWQNLERRCAQDRLLSGTLPEAREKGLADARKLQESLQKTVEAMADLMDLPLPQLPDDMPQDEAAGPGVEVWTKQEDDEVQGPFDDEETRAFYCDVPDLLTTVPPALLGRTVEEIEAQKIISAQKYGSLDVPEEEVPLEEATEAHEQEEEEEEEVDDEDEVKATVPQEGGDDEDENKDTPHYRLMVLLEQELPECHRREQIDEITERFCTNHGSSRKSRKRLLDTLFAVPRSRLDLLPYYARMTATLDRVWDEMGPELVKSLEQQFHGQAKFKKNQNLESRMRTARYIGELTKFRVAPPIVFLRCLQRCLEDFTINNVEVACALLESCGRFLYRMKHTSSRISTLMDTMTRLSKAKNLDERQQSLIKASFYSVKPPPSGPRKRAKEYPPLEAYLRYLLMSRLSPSNSSCSFVAKQIARLPWHDPSEQCGALVCRIMMKASRKGRYKTIGAIATVAANLRTQRAAGEATVRLVDAVLEELRWALESPNFRDQQRTLTYSRLLGELYCSSQVSAQVILQQLYDFLNLGHEIPESLREASKKLAMEQQQEQSKEGDEGSNVQLPVYNSTSGLAQTIQEDEEMEDEALALETKEEGEDEAPEKPEPVAVSEYSRYDPRVPSPQDPPNSAYRIKLVCTLLEVVAKQISSRNNLPRVKGFLVAFQRYLFTKTMLPTDVEFALLDTFDILDSQWKRLSKGTRNTDAGAKETGFPRFATWLEAHNATVAIEESEALFEQEQRAKLASGMGEESKDGNSLLIDEDSASMMDDDDERSIVSSKDSASEAGEMENEEEDDDEAFSSEGEDESDSDEGTDMEDGEEEAFDQEAYMQQMEEEAFERELRRVTMDALEKGKNTSRKLVADYMPSGSQIIKKKPGDTAKAAETSDNPTSGITLGGKAGISFQVLKKGSKGKVEAKELIVPVDTNLAQIATKQDDEKARERDVIKQRVLQYEADSAEAELSGGNVYLEQEKLQFIRNRPLSMAEIDKNFGTVGGNLRQGDKSKASGDGQQGRGPGPPGRGGVSRPPYSGRGRGGRGRGRSSSSGRTLFG